MMMRCLENHLGLYIPPKNDFTYKQGVNYFLKKKKFLSFDEIKRIEKFPKHKSLTCPQL
jgi:hypothetical protein